MSTRTVVSGAARIEHAVHEANVAGRLAIAPFLTAGYPSLDGFPAMLDRVAGEADLIEVGVPFTDPMADGVTIQEASHAALAAGATLDRILDTIRGRTRDVPIVLMSYFNPILAFGLAPLARTAAEAGVAGVIVPDLPLEEALPIRQAFDEAGVALVQLVSPVTPHERARRICEASRGFVYAVTATGTTGRSVTLDDATRNYLRRVKEISTLPVLAGFGIRAPTHVRAMIGVTDGVIVGSALIEAIRDGRDPVAVLRSLRMGTEVSDDSGSR